MKLFLKCLAAGLLILATAWCFLSDFSNEDYSLQKTRHASDGELYFEWIPIHRFSSFRLPILTIKIGGKPLFVELD